MQEAGYSYESTLSEASQGRGVPSKKSSISIPRREAETGKFNYVAPSSLAQREKLIFVADEFRYC